MEATPSLWTLDARTAKAWGVFRIAFGWILITVSSIAMLGSLAALVLLTIRITGGGAGDLDALAFIFLQTLALGLFAPVAGGYCLVREGLRMASDSEALSAALRKFRRAFASLLIGIGSASFLGCGFVLATFIGPAIAGQPSAFLHWILIIQLVVVLTVPAPGLIAVWLGLRLGRG